MSKTKGRKAIFVDVAGQDVEGLYFDKALNVYYYYQTDPITNKRKKITKRNKAKAALELYNYKLLSSAKDYTKIFLYTQDDEDGGKILKSSNDKSYIIPSAMPNREKVEFIDEDGDKSILTTDEAFNVPNNFIIERFVEMYDANPRLVAEIFIQMGRDDLAGIINLPKNYRATRTKLSDLLVWYLTDDERSTDTLKYAKLFYNQFCSIVNVQHIEQITLEHITVYKNEIERIKKNNKLSTRWVKSRYEMVKRIVRNAKLHIEDKSELNRVQDNMAMLTSSSNNNDMRKKPKPISKEEYQTILNYVKSKIEKTKGMRKKIKYSKWQSIILLAANTCSYLADIVDMDFVSANGELGLDLQNKTLSMYREKKNTAKVAVLWTETVEALELYNNLTNSKSNVVIITKKDGRNGAGYLRKEFLKIKLEVLKLNPSMRETIEFNQIRDAGFTACALALLPIEQRNYVSGHKNKGDDDAYLLRQPKLAEPACNAMYDYFMNPFHAS